MSRGNSPCSILALDFGAAQSHGALIEPVEGVYRLVACAEAPAVGSPQVDLAASLGRCVARLEETTGRALLAPDGALRLPSEGQAGVDTLIVTASAAPPLDCALIGLTEELSLQSGLAVCRASHASVGRVIALAQGHEGRRRDLALLREAPPEVIVLLGGVDGGPTHLLVEAADLLATLFAEAPAAERPAVVFAGNPEARRPIAQALGEGWDYTVVENVQPSVGALRPQELQRELAQRYARRKLPQLPGYDALAGRAAAPILPSDAGLGIILQYLSRQMGAQRRVLGLDLGAAQTVAALAGRGYAWSRRAHAQVPRDGDAPWHLYAAAQEALAPALADLAALGGEDVAGGWAVDMIAARGGLLACAGGQPWAALALLDAVQPLGVTRLVLDWASLWPQLGALAQVEPLAALQVLRYDALLELGSVLGLAGRGRVGQWAGHVNLAAEGGAGADSELIWGHLARLPLAEGVEAGLAFEPAGRRRRRGEPAPVRGGKLGLLLDARGRPLALPDEPAARRQAVEAWLEQLS